MLRWANQYDQVSFLDSNQYDQDKYAIYEWLIAVGAEAICKPMADSYDQLRKFHAQYQDWIFGHLSYDLKNELEDLSSSHSDIIGFHLLYFFVPKHIVLLKKQSDELEIWSLEDGEVLWESILDFEFPIQASFKLDKIVLDTDESEYLRNIQKIRGQIEAGDFYEMNYCLSWEGMGAGNEVGLFEKLNRRDKSPFAAFYKNDTRYLLCGSLERYLQKNGLKIISQPIKGTIKRELDDITGAQKEKLLNDEKERAENVMIVDLVRNDLNRTAKRNSVQVAELFGIYSFEHVHQMISTVQSELDEKHDWIDLIKSTFPMGSMTGATKN